MPTQTTPPQIVAVIAAAGCSTRFGANKLLASAGGWPLVRHSVELARSVCGSNVVLVTGRDWQDVVAAAGKGVGFFAINAGYTDGLGSSIALAARSVSHSADAMLFLLADQFAFGASHLQQLVDAWSGAANEIVATSFSQTSGPPVLFGRDTFAELATLTGDRGAHALFDNPHFQMKTVQCDAAALDIDTPEDLARF